MNIGWTEFPWGIFL